MAIDELLRLRTDAERFRWWFDTATNKGEYLNEYLRGVREFWTLDQWRASIDAAMRSPAKVD